MLGLRFCARAFSSCGERGPVFIAVRGPLTIVASLVAEHRLQTRRLSSCGSRAQPLRGTWDPPRPGLEPMSPALAGRLSTTAPPGKPCHAFLQHQDWGFPFPPHYPLSVLANPSHLFGSAGREQVVCSLSLARGVVQGLAGERKPTEAQSLHQGRSGRDLQWSVCDSAASIRGQVAHHPRRILIWQDFTSK